MVSEGSNDYFAASMMRSMATNMKNLITDLSMLEFCRPSGSLKNNFTF
jgi:hypothetical protein